MAHRLAAPPTPERPEMEPNRAELAGQEQEPNPILAPPQPLAAAAAARRRREGQGGRTMACPLPPTVPAPNRA
eukprot:scaffold30296_cov51-Isochrysis_galbana.AAC.1